MKKIIGVVALLVLVMALAGCGNQGVETLEVPESSDGGTVSVEAGASGEEADADNEVADVENEAVAENSGDDENNDSKEAVEETQAADESSDEGDGATEEEYQDYVDVDFVDRDGNTVSISDYEGKFIALNFFGTWCDYCMKEMPDFQKVYSEYDGDDFVILLVNATTTEKGGQEAVIEWYDESGYTMPMVFDLDGYGMSVYPVQGFPTTYFINKEGKVLGAVPGMMDEAMMLSVLEAFNQ